MKYPRWKNNFLRKIHFFNYQQILFMPPLIVTHQKCVETNFETNLQPLVYKNKNPSKTNESILFAELRSFVVIWISDHTNWWKTFLWNWFSSALWYKFCCNYAFNIFATLLNVLIVSIHRSDQSEKDNKCSYLDENGILCPRRWLGRTSLWFKSW